MTKNTILIKTVLLISILVIVGTAHGWGNKSTTKKGANKSMETYHIGRFSFRLPKEMKLMSRSHKLREEEINEITWPAEISHEKAREAEWNKFMSKIKTLTPPKGKDSVIIRMRDISGVGKWTKAVFYYDYFGRPRTATWALLMDAGPVGVWIKDNPPGLVEDENKTNNAINNISNIGKSYHLMDSISQKPISDWFYLKYGAINLPYLWQESSDVRFEEHPLNLTLRIRMNETYSVEKAGLIEKTIDAIVSGYANGVQIKKIRSHKRTVAGLNGEEEVLRMTAKDEDALSFVWEFNGKENSGESPRIVITMDTPYNSLDEKLKIWDAVLDSMKPMFERK
jgi:hypothetical protein